MKKSIVFMLVALLFAFLTACETTSQVYKMSKKGSAGFTCDEITKAFSAYEIDRQSSQALSVLSPLIGLSTGTDALSSPASNEYFVQAKSAANVALLVQGCSAIP